MSDKRYEANIIRATAVEPANNLESTSAPGVWSIDEVVELQKKSKWPTVGNVATNVDSLFSTFLYEGNGGAKVIENGIALGNSNDGGSFKGGTGTWVNGPASSDFGFGTGDWTIEFFSIVQQNKNYNTYIDLRTPSGTQSNYMPVIYSDTNGALYYFANDGSTGNRITASGAITIGTWYHIAVSKSGTSTKMFVNGTQVGSTFTDNLTYQTPTATWGIGAAAAQTNYEIDGFLSNVRIIKGTALYTSNFTAPTSALTAVTNTKLLTLQGDTPFVDNSSSSHALTLNGSPVASDFGPFTGTGGEGGLVWIKDRDSGSNSHMLYDTARGAYYAIKSNTTDVNQTRSTGLTAFTSSGFTLGSLGAENSSGNSKVSWTFRKKAKFLDIVTYTGDGNADRQINHNLGSVPGMMIVKKYAGSTTRWSVYHRSLGTGKFLNLDDTAAVVTQSDHWQTAPTATQFTVETNGNVNNNGDSYVAYLFAHNNNDGEFGPDGDADIIKCGSFTTDGSGNATVNLGFEPQFLIEKQYSGTRDWRMYDSMRGWTAQIGSDSSPTNKGYWLEPNTSDAGLNWTGASQLLSNGFKLSGQTANADYIYIAIRRPQAAPTAATQVFEVFNTTNTGGASNIGSMGPSDLILNKRTDGSQTWRLLDRLRGGTMLRTDSTDSESSNGFLEWDTMTGVNVTSSGAAYITNDSQTHWSWKRAPSYFDVCCYSGTGSNRTVSHNLGVVPEMMWVKSRTSSGADWNVYHSATGNGHFLKLNGADASTATSVSSSQWNFTTPTSSVFYLGPSSQTNYSGHDYVSYLFATVAGISKVGSYTGNGASTQTIDCGFSSGARFILLKRTDAEDQWYVFDSVRGIVSGNDPFLLLNTDAAEVSNQDLIEPNSSGFIINNWANGSGSSWIFYAIAT